MDIQINSYLCILLCYLCSNGHAQTPTTNHTDQTDIETTIFDEITRFEVEFPTGAIEKPMLIKNGYYNVQELNIDFSDDGDQTTGNSSTTREYKDKRGRAILIRAFLRQSKEHHDTYYVYDDFGNLTFIIPPKVTIDNGVDLLELQNLCYQYVYDQRNRLVEKKTPGKGWEYIVYNKIDQPILTQDAIQRTKTPAEWLFTKYDALGRVAYTGLHQNNKTRQVIQLEANNTNIYTHFITKLTQPITLGGTKIFYSNDAMPKEIMKIYTINYYDDYTFDGMDENIPKIVFDEPISLNTKRLTTASKVSVLGTDYWISTITFYDNKTRPILVYKKNEYLKATDITKNQYDLTGKVITSQHKHVKNNNAPIVTVDTYTYNHTGKLLTHTQKINDQREEMIVDHIYNHIGQLESKFVGNIKARPLQKIDYRYNNYGLLTHLNDPNNVMGDDLFALKINYNDFDFNELSSSFHESISEVQWKTANDQDLRAYHYTYDELNRITAAISNNGHYDLQGVSYDRNGNITEINRLKPTKEGNLYRELLRYSYAPSSNQLLSVFDKNSNAGGFKNDKHPKQEFQYDLNGNIISYLHNGITCNIEYNHLNLPVKIINKKGELIYTYSALGEKLSKKFIKNSTESNTALEPTVHYNGKYNYTNMQFSGIMQLQFFKQPEGYVEPNFANDRRTIKGFEYVYQFKDHLGNIRLSYSDTDKDGKIDIIQNNLDADGDGDNYHEIRQEKNYYPFGLQHKGYNNAIRPQEYPYGFNGKEEQNELSLEWLDFISRNYDPQLGRWISIDPSADQQQRHSPYNYASNNPIYFADRDFTKNTTIDFNGD